MDCLLPQEFNVSNGMHELNEPLLASVITTNGGVL